MHRRTRFWQTFAPEPTSIAGWTAAAVLALGCSSASDERADEAPPYSDSAPGGGDGAGQSPGGPGVESGNDANDAAGATGDTDAPTDASSTEGNPDVVNATDQTVGSPAGGAGNGLVVGGQCYPVCESAATDDDGDGFGFERGLSCLVDGSPAAAGAGACSVDLPEEAAIPPGDGFFVGDRCFPRCASAESDADPDTGETDGFGFELGASCIVVDSDVALAALPCIPPALDGSDIPPGDGFFVGEQCFARCVSELTVDADGFGFEQQQSCVLPGSDAAGRGIPCVPPPIPFDLIPGDGFFMPGQDGLTCFPPCLGDNVDAEGFGFEQQRSCVQPGSIGALRGIPCVPEPPDVLGLCPVPLPCPSSDGQTIACGCTHVEGLAVRKQQIIAAGGDRRFLASAMMETPTLTADYPLGDVFPGPDGQTGTADDRPKTGGAANFGITKMNWTMIRQCHGDYAGLGNGDYLRGIELNDSLALDVQVYSECRNFFGNGWYGGHRAGSPGLNNADVRRFQAGTDWTFEMLEEHLDDDVRFFVQIQAI